MNAIDRNAYPQLNDIAWDRADRYIAPEDAFAAYERRWSYVDRARLLPEEQQLIKLLTEEYGKGCFDPATAGDIVQNYLPAFYNSLPETMRPN